MTKFINTAGLADAAAPSKTIHPKPLARFNAANFSHPLSRLTSAIAICLLCGLSLDLRAQAVFPTGPQQLSFAGLRSVANQGQINAVQVSAQGDLFLLIDQKDGVRLLKTDPAASVVLAQAQIGAKGDIGLAMALDPAGNVYITGTATSGALTSTSGAAFPTSSGTSINSFVAKFDGNLNATYVTFAGGASIAASSIAATADAAFITGSIFSATLPVTPAGFIQTPADGSTQNGFIEKFSPDGSKLLYATYLSGAGGSTSPTAIAADDADSAYIAGTTTSPGYPTAAAIVPAQPGATSGFLTKLAPAGDGIVFSTYIPGAGISSLTIDPVAANLLLSGSISLGQFPIATVSTPLTAITYQVLARISLDGSTVLGSTVLAPGTQSFVAAGPAETAWVVGSLSLPLLPLTPLSPIGNSFAVHVNAANLVDQAARFGGIAESNPFYASAPVNLTSIAVDNTGNAIAAGNFAPSASQSLLATQTFDLPLANAPTAALPSSVRAAVLPPSACAGSLCAGSAAYLAKLILPATTTSASASLALSTDDSPNITLRNLGSSPATNLQITLAGFTFATNCAATLPAGGECSISLTGIGPGSITVSAANATTQIAALPALTASAAPIPVVFSPKELDFGIVSSTSGTVTRTISATNLTQQNQTFISALDISAKVTLPYTIAETTSDCTLAGVSTKLLAPGGVCHISIGLTASNTAIHDGPIHQYWLIGKRDVQMTAYAQASALSLSAGEIDFGTQYIGGLYFARYLYLSNNSTNAAEHTAVTLPVASPFSVTDRCPSLLQPLTVCQLQLAYHAAQAPSADSVTLSLDQGLTALVTGQTLPKPATNGAGVNPNLTVSSTSLVFANPVAVTSASGSTQTITIQNTGTSAFALSLALTGDFTDTTNCATTLAGNSSCNVVFTFVPTQSGTRQGLLAITAGNGTTPAYVALSGIGTGILSPANNGTLNFGAVTLGQPSVQWFKITQPFTTFSAATESSNTGSPYTVVLVEDMGFGHGQPPSMAFTTNTSSTCLNCWIGVRFSPLSAGPETATLTLTSSITGNPYVLSLGGSGLPLTGLLLTPATSDFGPVSIHSVSPAALFVLTNLVTTGTPINVATPVFTGDFAAISTPTSGVPCGGLLAYTASCFIQIAFAPTASGPRDGTLTVQADSAIATALLSGYGSSDLGVSLDPIALVFNNIPGKASTSQTITVTNTTSSTEQIASPIATTTNSTASSFTATSTCDLLVAGAACSVVVQFTPATAPTAGTVAIPVTSNASGAPILTTYTVPLTGAYTADDAGLQIVAIDPQYGPQATGAVGVTRQFTIENLTQKSLVVTIALPRQFILIGSPCSRLAPNASCDFSVAFLPLDNGDITGTLFAQATPSDGSATLKGMGYVEGYGVGSGTLAITGALSPGNILDFGQIPSSQSTQRILTLTNTSTTMPLTIRRITSQWPFASTTNTCGARLATSASCTVTLTYTPINQVAAGSASPPSIADAGTLVVESDAASSPDLIVLTGSATPAVVTAPSNTAPLAAIISSQNSLSFPKTIVGAASAQQAVTLSNAGTATITIFSIQTSPDFTVVEDCSAILPGASCNLLVTFTPQSTSQGGDAGMRVSAIEISSNASTSLEFISLVGTSSPSTLTLTPASLDLGSVLVGAKSTLSVQLNNTGAGPATLTAISATGDYRTAAGSCPATGKTLAAAASCSLQVIFEPTQSGTRAGVLTVANSATAVPLSVQLTGTGIQSQMQISPATLGFGSIAIGTSSSQTITLSNNGTASITAIALAVSGDYVITLPCALTLPPGANCPITLTFTPTATGPRDSTLIITSSDTTSPAAVPLSGVGTQSHLQLSSASLSFGSIAVGTSSSQSITLANNGSAPITGIALAVSGDYLITSPCGLATLVPGSSCAVMLSFAPTAAGPRNSALTITSSDISSPATVALTGSGNLTLNGSFTLTAAGSSTASATIASGASAPYSLTITPLNNFTGTVILNCTPVVPAAFASCSLLPSSVTLSSTAQTAVATLNTVTSVAQNSPVIPGTGVRSFRDAVLCLLFPAFLFTWKARTSRRPAWRAASPLAWAVLASFVLLSSGGCGGSTITPSSLRYAAAGAYEYQVTATSTASSTPITQTVTLSLIVK